MVHYSSTAEEGEHASLPKKSPAEDASSYIAQQLSSLESTVTRLESRLSRVLRDQVIGTVESTDRLSSVPANESPHTVDLRKHAEFVRALEDRLQVILDRLDL